MGPYLSNPNTDKHSETDSNDEISYTACGMQGLLFNYLC